MLIKNTNIYNKLHIDVNIVEEVRNIDDLERIIFNSKFSDEQHFDLSSIIIIYLIERFLEKHIEEDLCSKNKLVNLCETLPVKINCTEINNYIKKILCKENIK